MRALLSASRLRTALTLAAMLAVCATLSGCLVAGYSSGGGWFIWPGSIVITLLAILFFVLRRR